MSTPFNLGLALDKRYSLYGGLWLQCNGLPRISQTNSLYAVMVNLNRGVWHHLPTFFDQILVSGGNFLTVAIAAHNLSLLEQGKIGYLLASYLATNIVNATVIFQWASFSAPRVTNRTGYFRQLALVQLVLALVTALICVAGLFLAGNASEWHLSLFELASIFLFLFFQQLADFTRRAAYLFQTPRHAAFTSASVYLPRLGLLLGLAPASMADTVVIMGATSFLPAGQTLLHATRVTGLGKEVSNFLSSQPTHARWLMASGPLIWIAASAPVFMAGAALGLEIVGIFITVRSLTNIANVAMEILETDVAARAGRAAVANQASLQSFFRTIRWFGRTAWLLGMGLCLALGDTVLRWVFGAAYAGYAAILSIMWLATGFNFLFRLRCVEERSYGRGRTITLAYAISSAVAVLFSYPMVSWLGVYGIAWVICLSITSSLLVVSSRRLQ